MKKKLIFVMIIFLGILTGCKTEKQASIKNSSAITATTATTAKTAVRTQPDKTKDYEAAMEKGNGAIVNQDFDQAEASFQLALEYKSDSEEAKNYLQQVTLYKEALQNFDSKHYNQAFDLANTVKATAGSKNMARYAEGLLKKIDQALEEQKKIKTEPVAPPKITVRKYSDTEKQAIMQEFLSWAIPQAEIGNMSVSSQFFAHGAGGNGDWYAETVDGRIQVQELNKPGYEAFPLHALGGVVFYTSLDGSVGLNESFESIASGYTTKADSQKKITKYLLADTGNVYEYGAIGTSMISFSSGFAEASDNGQFTNDGGIPVFQQSGDVNAINKLKEILSNYQ